MCLGHSKIGEGELIRLTPNRESTFASHYSKARPTNNPNDWIRNGQLMATPRREDRRTQHIHIEAIFCIVTIQTIVTPGVAVKDCRHIHPRGRKHGFQCVAPLINQMD